MSGRSLRHALARLSLASALLYGTPVAMADNTGDADISAEELGKGFRAIDMLQDLKAAYDQRLADCRAAGETDGYCGCINSRATLDLTYADFVEVVGDGNAERAARHFGIPASRAAEAIAAGGACRTAR